MTRSLEISLMFMISQISVFLQDKTGRVSDIVGILAGENLNITGFDIADSAEGYGVFRLIVDDSEKAIKILHESHIAARETKVIGVYLPNEQGALTRLLDLMKENDLDIEYMYAAANNNIIFALDQNEKGERVLESGGYKITQSFEI